MGKRFSVANIIMAGLLVTAVGLFAWGLHQALQTDLVYTGAEAEKALRDVLNRRCNTRVEIKEVLHAVFRREMDPSEWYMFRIDPAAIDTFTGALIANVKQENLVVKEEEDRSSLRDFNVGELNPPAWWQPQKLEDMELLLLDHRNPQGGGGADGFHFAFSRKTGIVYLLVWTT
ncbi:MAG TPA: hypothetical protein VHP11_03325 [Tepidisphaeraceae bacterium]|nr:hypothetical protein [Tepidisphaeraceae bacterium]